MLILRFGVNLTSMSCTNTVPESVVSGLPESVVPEPLVPEPLSMAGMVW